MRIVPKRVHLVKCSSTGATAVAAERLGRDCIICDISADYLEQARGRLREVWARGQTPLDVPDAIRYDEGRQLGLFTDMMERE
jgi:hypothetical protein